MDSYRNGYILFQWFHIATSLWNSLYTHLYSFTSRLDHTCYLEKHLLASMQKAHWAEQIGCVMIQHSYFLVVLGNTCTSFNHVVTTIYDQQTSLGQWRYGKNRHIWLVCVAIRTCHAGGWRTTRCRGKRALQSAKFEVWSWVYLLNFLFWSLCQLSQQKQVCSLIYRTSKHCLMISMTNGNQRWPVQYRLSDGLTRWVLVRHEVRWAAHFFIGSVWSCQKDPKTFTIQYSNIM